MPGLGLFFSLREAQFVCVIAWGGGEKLGFMLVPLFFETIPKNEWRGGAGPGEGSEASPSTYLAPAASPCGCCHFRACDVFCRQEAVVHCGGF